MFVDGDKNSIHVFPKVGFGLRVRILKLQNVMIAMKEETNLFMIV